MKFPLFARFLFALCLLISVEARAQAPSQIENPRRANRSWVADGANVLSESEERRINAVCAALKSQNGTELVVLTVRSLGGRNVKNYSNELFRLWGIGGKGTDNGVLLLNAVDDRKIWIEVGYGLEGVLPDGKAGEIWRTQVAPSLANKRYSDGLYRGALAIAQVVDPGFTAPAEVSDPASPALPPVSQPAVQAPIGRSTPEFAAPVYPAFGGLIFALLGLVVFLFPLLLFGGMIWFFTASMRRPLRCSNCKAPVIQLSDMAELSSLSPVQRFEQQIGARDYRVWRCSNCRNEDITAHDLPDSRFVQCPTCRHQTASTLVETVRQATHRRGGQERVILSCQWRECQHSNFYNRPTPPIPRGYGQSYGGGNNGTDFLTGIVLGSILNNSNQSGGWNSGGWGSGSDSGSSSGDFGGGGFDSGPSDFGGGDSGGGGAGGDY